MESIAPVKNISILQSINTMARMYINPLPAQYGAKILEFFKAVFEKFGGEAIVLLFYNEKTGKYKIVPPTQKVTAAACDYNRGVTVEGFTMIGTIHSHANFSAFHSGVDDADEKTFDGLHITYGNVRSEEFSLSASIVANGSRFIVNPEDYMLGLSKTKDVDEKEVHYSTKIYKFDPKTSKMVLDEVASSKSAYSQRKLDKRYLFNVPASKRQFNSKWMSLVERGTYTYNYSGYAANWRGQGRYAHGRYGHGSRWNGSRWNNWGGHYDSDLWKQAGRFVGGQKQIPFVGTGPVTPPAVVTSEKEKDCELSNPCLSCKNRGFKIINEIEDVDYQEEMYHCEKCKVLFTTTDAEPKCPTCKTDMYLNYIDEKDLKNNHSVGDPQFIDNGGAALNSAQSMELPKQQGFMQCLECENSFLGLSSDECCPHCQTLLPDTVKVSDDDDIEWQCPHCRNYFGEDDMLNANECPWCYGLVDLLFDEPEEKMKCPSCGTEFLVEEQGTCPKCQMIFSVQMIDSLNQSRADSGTFLDQSDEEHQAILDAAAEVDRRLERIPDPEKGPNQPKPFSQTIIDKMRKVFGGGNDGSMH
jgi:hypothetical protein